MWPRKRKSTTTADVVEARKLRAEAVKDMRQLEAQASYVTQLSRSLIERRAQNHFGDDLQITFRPRGT